MGPVNWWLVSLVIIMALGIIALIVILTVRTYRRQTTTGKEELIGKYAVVTEELNPAGTVLYQGDLWAAIVRDGRILSGEEVIITAVQGLTLSVMKKAKE